MPLSQTVVIILAGFCAGAINAVVGWGTVITFPILLAMGYPPMTSTMSNTVGLVAGSMSGAWGYRRELRGQWNRLRWQIPASLIGGGLGAWLLLHLPEKVFAEVVPVLLIAAMLLVVIGPRIQAWVRDRAGEHRGGAELYVGGVRSDQLAGGRSHCDCFADWWFVGCALWSSVVAECVARHDCYRRAYWSLPTVDCVGGPRLGGRSSLTRGRPYRTTFNWGDARCLL